MKRRVFWTVLVLVGGHLVLGLTLLAIESTHGINDQDVSYAVALAFYYLNLPTVRLLKAGVNHSPPITMILAMGIAQWTVLALAIASLWNITGVACRAITGRRTQPAESTTE